MLPVGKKKFHFGLYSSIKLDDHLFFLNFYGIYNWLDTIAYILDSFLYRIKIFSDNKIEDKEKQILLKE